MTNYDYIEDLLDRMANNNYRDGETTVDGVLEGSKMISATAFEEASNIEKTDYTTYLCNLILSVDDATKKRNSYFILGHLARNTNDESAASFLINQLEIEKMTEMLISILSRLGEIVKPRTIRIESILKHCDSRNQQIRGTAYDALTNSYYPVEKYLLSRLDKSHKNTEITYLLRALQYVGTLKAIPNIKRFLRSRDYALQNTAWYCLAVILIREGDSISNVHQQTKISAETLSNLNNSISKFTRLSTYE